MPVPVVNPLPERLTAPLPLPPAPPERCRLHGRPAVCVIDALDWASRLLGVVGHANADRAAAARISRSDPRGEGAPHG